jgi:hypothetical protein
MVAEIIAKLEAFVAHPVVDSMTPVWSLSQDDAREILEAFRRMQSLLGKAALVDTPSFQEIRQAVGTKTVTFR